MPGLRHQADLRAGDLHLDRARRFRARAEVGQLLGAQPFQRALGSIAKTPTKTIPSRGSLRQDRLSDARTAEGPTTTARARGGLGLIATVRQQVLRVRRDPEVGQERTRATVTPCHARVGPTTPKSATQTGVRLTAIGKVVRRASLLGRIP